MLETRVAQASFNWGGRLYITAVAHTTWWRLVNQDAFSSSVVATAWKYLTI